MSDFYDMVLAGEQPNAAGIVERSAKELREGGAAAKPKQTLEGGAAGAAPVSTQTQQSENSNSSNPIVASPGVANLSGVMVLPSLNVKPRLWCRLTSSPNFHSIVKRQATDNSRRKFTTFQIKLAEPLQQIVGLRELITRNRARLKLLEANRTSFLNSLRRSLLN